MEWKGRMERKSGRERQTGQRHWNWICRDGCTINKVRGFLLSLSLFCCFFPLFLCVPGWLSQWQCMSLLPLVRDFRWMTILFSVRLDLFFIWMKNNAWAYTLCCGFVVPSVILPVCLKSLYFNHFVRIRGFYTSPAASLCSIDFVRSQMAFNVAICGYILNSSGLWVNEQVLFCEVGPGLHQNENNAFVCVLWICSRERHRTYFASNVCISTIL